jgi:type IV pilus assembly protein PilN
MIRINLLPFRAARTKENVRRQISIFLGMIGILLLVLFSVYLHLSSQEEEEKLKLENVKQELVKYTQQAKEVDEINKENDMLQKKIDIINDLEKVRKEPVSLLSLLTDTIVEERMWLTSFEIKETNVSIDGMALDEITVADFNKRLQASPLFSDASLKIVKQSEADNVKLKSFKLTGIIKKTDVKTPVSSKAVK